MMQFSPAGTHRGGLVLVRVCRSVFGWPSLSKEKRALRKKQLLEESHKGFVSELHEYRKNRGKLFHAQSDLLPRGKSNVMSDLLPRDEAMKFPSISGRSLSGVPLSLPHAQPSLVLVSLTGSGMVMCDKYRKILEGEFGGKMNLVELSLLNKAVFIFLKNWIERNLRKDLPPSRHSGFMVCTGKTAANLNNFLDIHNSFVGYAYLLDGDGLIRWRAHAMPTQEELQGMLQCTQKLCP